MNVWSGLTVVLVWAWKHLGQVAAEAVAAAEKHQVLADGTLTNEELEQIAVDLLRPHVPLPESILRALIRRVCRRRKRAEPKIADAEGAS